MTVAFIGLGQMGWHMAGHLVAAGHDVVAHDVAADRADAWRDEQGGRVVAERAAAVAAARIVITSLPADRELREVAYGPTGVLEAMPSGAVWVDHTTASATVARELAHAADERGLSFLDAPVSGGVDGARAGTLAVMVGGERAAYERVEPVVAAYASRMTLMGGAGAGQLTKMTNQICVVGLCQALAEGLDFAEAAGLDTARVVEVMLRGASASWEMEHRSGAMLEGKYDFGFATELMRKDIGLCLHEARELDVPLPVTALVDQFLADVERLGGSRWDWCSLMERQRMLRTGAPPPKTSGSRR
ncbi:MAG: NAD(P)-dependent oxidoreductase [Gaiellales bacterium]